MKVADIQVFATSLPFQGHFATSRGTIGSTGSGLPKVFVRVTDEAGHIGWGEAGPSHRWSYETVESVVSTLKHYLIPVALGRDIFDLEGLHEAMDREIAPGLTRGQPIAKAALDIALHDLVGRALQVPVWAIFGSRKSRQVVLSWTLTSRAPEGIETEIAEAKRRGYDNFNLKIGVNPQEDIQLMALVRKLTEGFVWADANGGYTFPEALKVARKMEEIGVDVFEQPLPANQWNDYAGLARSTAVPIGIDESLCSVSDLLQLVRLGAFHIFVVKVTRMGGLRPARLGIEIAHNAGLLVMGSGLTDAGVGLIAACQLLAAYGVSLPAALNGPQFLADDVLADPLPLQGDILTVPEGSGLGITVDETKLERYRIAR